ncbi:hypothetical protein, partial [Vibrio owensii]|uniref:hypothetical protein n=1 Tax=Vibrio owensii TaxID=696485 RepID=UPI003DA0C67A
NVLVNLSHEAEQQGTGSIDASTEWGKSGLADLIQPKSNQTLLSSDKTQKKLVTTFKATYYHYRYKIQKTSSCRRKNPAKSA